MPSSFYPEFKTETAGQPEVIIMASGPLFLRLGVPSGMEELLEDLAREVLRHQPRDVYRFAAVHFQGLLMQRESVLAASQAQTAALSPQAEKDGIEPIKEALPVTEDVTKKDVETPPLSPASDSGAASGTNSPVGSPIRTPGPQAVRTKLTTTGNKHPSPVFQQALKTAFNAESLISDRSSISPSSKHIDQLLSPTEDDNTTTSPIPASKTSSLSISDKQITNSETKSFEHMQFVNAAANNLAKFLPNNLNELDSETSKSSNLIEKRVDSASPIIENYLASNVTELTDKVVTISKETTNELIKQTTENIDEYREKASERSNDILEETADISDKINQVANDITTEVTQVATDVTENIDSIKDEVSSKANEEVANIETTIIETKNNICNETKALVTSAEEIVSHVNESINDQIQDVTTNVSGIVDDISNNVEDVTDAATENITEISNKLQETKENFITDVSGEISAEIDDISTVKNETMSQIDETSSHLQQVADDVNEATCSIAAEIRESAGEITTECVKETKESINEQIEMATKEIVQNTSSTFETINSNIDSVVSYTEIIVQRASENVSTTIDEAECLIDGEVNQISDNVEKNYEKELDITKETVDELVNQHHNIIEIKNDVTDLLTQGTQAVSIEKDAIEHEISNVVCLVNNVDKQMDELLETVNDNADITSLDTKEIIENDDIKSNDVNQMTEYDISKNDDVVDENVDKLNEEIMTNLEDKIEDCETKQITEESGRKISTPIAIEGINVTDERSTSPVAEVSANNIATSFVEKCTYQNDDDDNNKEDEFMGQSLISKRTSELGSEDFKPQTPEIVAQSPDQSTYDDVSAGVLLEEYSIPVVPQLDELAIALLEEEAIIHKEETMSLDETSETIAKIIIMNADLNENENKVTHINNEHENIEGTSQQLRDVSFDTSDVNIIHTNKLVQNETDDESVVAKPQNIVTIVSSQPSDHQHFVTFIESDQKLEHNDNTLDDIIHTKEVVTEEVDNILKEALIEANARSEQEANDGIIVEAINITAISEIKRYDDMNESIINTTDLLEENEETIDKLNEDSIVINTFVGQQSIIQCEKSPECRAAKQVRCECNDGQSPVIVDEICISPNPDESEPSAPPEEVSIEKETPLVCGNEVSINPDALLVETDTNMYEEHTLTTEETTLKVEQILDETIIPDSRNEQIEDFLHNKTESSSANVLDIEKISTDEVTKAVEAAVEQLFDEISNDVTNMNVFEEAKVSQETGEFSPVVHADNTIEIVQEETTLSDSLQNSFPFENEGLGGVSSVFIRYSVSESDATHRAPNEVENNKEEDFGDKDIAETLIAAVLDSEGTITDEVHVSISEPAEVASVQTSSSKESEPAEVASVQTSSSKESEPAEVASVQTSSSKESEPAEVASMQTSSSKESEPAEVASVQTSSSKESEPAEVASVQTSSSKESEPAEVASVQTSSSKDAASLEHDDVQLQPENHVVHQEIEQTNNETSQPKSPTSEVVFVDIQASSPLFQATRTTNIAEAKNTVMPEMMSEECLVIETDDTETLIILDNETRIEDTHITTDHEDAESKPVINVGIESSDVFRAIPAQAIEPLEIFHAVPAQTVDNEDHALVETVDQVEFPSSSSPSALVELVSNSTLIAATPLAYIEPSAQDVQPCIDNISSDLVEHTTLVAAAPIAYSSSTLQQLRDTYSSSGECADISASATEPCVSWNGARAVDQESGELVTGDEDESVWATLEKEIEETKAATKIQAGFRGHKARQALLQREDAVQVVTSSAGSDVMIATPFSGVRHTSEFHDSLPLLPLASGDDPTDAAAAAVDNATNTREQPYDAERLNEDHAEDDDMSSSSGNFLDRAATKIQATYRGFKTRNELKKEKSPMHAQEPRVPVMSRVQSAPQILIHDSVEDRSAAKIQAGVRGYLTRQRLKRERSPQLPTSPEVEDAVVKIQAGFRGYKARQEVKTMREGKDS